MNSFPISIVDGFFSNPDAIRQYALSLDYKPDPDNRWPGMRSGLIHVINPGLFISLTSKFFSIYYDLNRDDIQWSVRSFFQLVDSGNMSGWIHTDSSPSLGNTASIVGGIIYLSPEAPLGSGTSIYRLKKEYQTASYENEPFKRQHYKGEMCPEQASKHRVDHNSQFEETVRVGNVYNRLISFDATQFHGAQDFFGDNKDSRLTLVFFIDKITTARTPVRRMSEV